MVASLAAMVCLPAVAQSIDGKFGLGIETPVLDVRHDSQDISVPAGATGNSTNNTQGQTSTAMGLFAVGAGLNAQYGVGKQTILGARLSLRRETLKFDGSSTAAHSQASFMPRFEYYLAPEETVQSHLGLEGGFERSTSNGAAGAASNSWLVGPTGGIAFSVSRNWALDVNASAYLLTGSGTVAGLSTNNSGYGVVLRVSLSNWFGTEVSGSSNQTNAAVPGTPSQQGATEAVNPATDETAGTDQATSRLSLDLQEGRRLLLAVEGAESSNKVRVTLLKVPYTDELARCRQVELHAPQQDPSSIAVEQKRISAPSGEVTAFSGTTDVERLKLLTVAPITTALVLTPDHWIGVCGQHWPITPLVRSQLKQYLERF